MHIAWSALCPRTELGENEAVLQKEVKEVLSITGARGVKVELVSDRVTKLMFTLLAASSLTAQEHHLTIGDVAGAVSAYAEFEPMST